MKDLLKELDLTSIKLDFNNQALKVAEELWEVLQAKKWNWDLKEEVADLILASILLAKTLDFDLEEILKDKIKKNNDKRKLLHVVVEEQTWNKDISKTIKEFFDKEWALTLYDLSYDLKWDWILMHSLFKFFPQCRKVISEAISEELKVNSYFKKEDFITNNKRVCLTF